MSRLREHTKTAIPDYSTKRNFPNYGVEVENIYPIRGSLRNARTKYVYPF